MHENLCRKLIVELGYSEHAAAQTATDLLHIDHLDIKEAVNRWISYDEATPVDVATPTLRKGSTSKQVGYLQQDLNYILGIKLDVDKDFGGATANAVKQFQNKYGLTVDGVYGEKTYKKMKSLLA